MKKRNPIQYHLRTAGQYKPKVEVSKKSKQPTRRDARKLERE